MATAEDDNDGMLADTDAAAAARRFDALNAVANLDDRLLESME